MKAGRKKGQTADNPAEFGTFNLKNIDRELWKKVKMLAVKRDTSIRSLIIGTLIKELKKEKLL